MRGDLSATTAADVCRTLAGDGSSGTLSIAGPDGPGAVLFDAGRVVGATSPTPRARLGDRLVGAGFLEQGDLDEVLNAQRAAVGRSRLGALLVERELVPRDAVRLFVQEQILDAMFEVVSWRFGAFQFQDGQPTMVPEVSLVMAVDDALVEVARRQREWHELSQVIPDLEAVPAFSDQASATADLEPDEFAVLASVDGERSVRTLAADLGYGEFELARIVYGLVLLGVVEVRLPQDEVGAALDDAFSYTPPAAPSDTAPTAPSDTAPTAPSDTAPTAPSDTAPTAPSDTPPIAPSDVDDTRALDEIGAAFDDAFAEARAAEATDAGAAIGSVDAVDAEAAADQPEPAASQPEPDDQPEPAASQPDPVASLPDPPVASEPGTYPPPAAVPDLPAASEEHPDRAGDPVPRAPEEVGPADEGSGGSSLSEVARELRGLGGDPPPSDPTPDETPADVDAPPQQPDPDPDPEQRQPAARSDQAADHDADVSEFLRELSRLSVDDDAPAKPRPKRPSDTPNRDDGDDGKRKKRGIFGWGN